MSEMVLCSSVEFLFLSYARDTTKKSQSPPNGMTFCWTALFMWIASMILFSETQSCERNNTLQSSSCLVYRSNFCSEGQ